MTTPQQPHHLHREINARQLGMLAIGGAIGTGLFFASGSAISQAGPGGAMLAYLVMGMAVYCMMQSLGEMATQLPVAGSFEAYAERFVDKSLGFALGWNYWFSWSITLAAEFVAGALIVKFWFPDSNATLWAMGFFVALMALNLLSVRAFAEAEYWFASIKVTVVLVFLVIGAAMILGLLGGDVVGLKHWTMADPVSHTQAPFPGGLTAILMVFLVAGFSFQGTEGVGLAAAEAADPQRSVPQAIRSVFWRILIFYVGAMFIVGTVIAFNDPNLLKGEAGGVAYSPFTLVFQRIPVVGEYAAHLMNFVILTAVLSAGNASLYVSSRMLQAMADRGAAPAFFGKLNRRGVPVAAVWATGLVGALAFLASTVGEQKIYQMLYNASGLTGFIIWLGIAICHLRFRRAWAAQGRSLDQLKFRARFFPVGPWLALALFVIVVFGANVWVFQAEQFSWFDFITNYAPIPGVLLLYFGHKLVRKTRLVRPQDARLDPEPEET